MASVPTQSTSFNLKKPVPANSAPLSHNQRDPFKNKVWEYKEGASEPISNATTLTVTKPANDSSPAADNSKAKDEEPKKADVSSPRKRHGHAAAAEGPVETLTYRDPFSGVYKK